jgi:hypothetical protein
VTAYTSAEATAVLVQLLIVALIVRRSYAMSKGVPYSTARLVILPMLILFLWGLSELESLLLTPWALPYLIVLDVAIFVTTFVAFARVAERITQARQEPTGVWSYQIGFSIAAIFLGAFVLRLVLAIVLFPSSLAFGSPPGGYAPEGQQLVLATVDGLFSVSAGLLVGRSLGAFRKVRAARSGSATVPSS